jgi:hypothetical protein
MSLRYNRNLPLFGLGPSSKCHGSNLWLSSIKIVLFHWTMDLKWPLSPESPNASSSFLWADEVLETTGELGLGRGGGVWGGDAFGIPGAIWKPWILVF